MVDDAFVEAAQVPVMFKDILIPMVADTIPERAIAVACAIAESNQAHVDALVGVSMLLPNAAVWAYCPEAFHETLKAAAEATVAALAERAGERLRHESVAHGVRRFDTLWLTIAEMTAFCARYADLVVLGRGRTTNGQERRLFAGLLTDSGRPLLLVPDEQGGTAGHAVIAWKTSREATRALHDALPLLRSADSVDLLLVEGQGGQDSASRADGDRVLAHLARHGVAARLVRREPGHLPTGSRILEHARESGARLIVAGGYSRSRAREQAFGGVTQELFERASCAVFFSH